MTNTAKDELPRAVQNGMSMPEYATWMFLADKKASDEPYTYVIKQSDLTKFVREFAEAECTRREQAAKNDAIVLACPAKDCRVAIVSSRQLSRWEGTGEITDPPLATSCWLPCEAHYQEGHEQYYFDKDGKEVSGDPDTFDTKRQSLTQKGK